MGRKKKREVIQPVKLEDLKSDEGKLDEVLQSVEEGGQDYSIRVRGD